MYADVIVDISHKNLDKPFSYRIPDKLESVIQTGSKVAIPFGMGNKERFGYVVGKHSDPPKDIRAEQIKEITGLAEKSVNAEENLIALAAFIKEQYGSTMISALKCVLPVKKEIKKREEKMIISKVPVLTLEQGIVEADRKKQRAKVRLLRELLSSDRLSYSLVTGKLNVSSPTVKSLEKEGFLSVEVTENELPFSFREEKEKIPALSEEQEEIINTVTAERREGKAGQYYIYGITGSGKTEVYMHLIEECLKDGKEAILLIPEIALTYQNLLRFYRRFGNKVAVMHSKLTDGEKYEQFKKAKEGKVSIMIGPRSALFAPFQNLGMIIIDEEHESSYKSETMPKFHAREVAFKLGEIANAPVVMGSATPSLESFYRIKKVKSRHFA